jgi:hypothetical protein
MVALSTRNTMEYGERTMTRKTINLIKDFGFICPAIFSMGKAPLDLWEKIIIHSIGVFGAWEF